MPKPLYSLVAGLLGVGAPLAGQVPAPAPVAPEVTVTATHDGRPFAYRAGKPVARAGHRLVRLTYPSPVTTGQGANDTVPARYYLPARDFKGRRPAVVCLHILNGNFELTRMFCASLAEAGMPALWFPLPWYGERRHPEGRRRGWMGRPQDFAAALSQSVKDIRRACDLLASRPEVDPGRIGLSGISLGAILAATTGAVEPRFQRLALVMGGGDLPRILAEARECRGMQRWLGSLAPADRQTVLERIRDHDPLRRAVVLRTRARAGRILMINPAEDRVVKPERARELARALGMEGRIRWLPGLGHYTAMAALPTILGETVAFFARDLPGGKPLTADRPALPKGARAPLVRLQAFLRDLETMLFLEPPAGRCRFLDLEVDLQVRGGPRLRGSVKWLRGAGERFRLEARLPDGFRVQLGGAPALWLAGKGGRVFHAEGKHLSPFTHVAREHKLKLQVAAGALRGAALSTAILQQVVKVKPLEDGALGLDVAGQGRGVLRYAGDGRTPTVLELTAGRVKGRITFRVWNPDGVATPALFAPAGDGAVRKVPAADLARMLGAAFNLAMEKLR